MPQSNDFNQQICDSCRLMFSTTSNLRALVSEVGYRHGVLYGRDEDWRCTLCGYVYLAARMHEHSEDQYTLFCFATKQGSPIWSQLANFGKRPTIVSTHEYPKDILQFDSIIFRWFNAAGDRCGMTGPRADDFLLTFSAPTQGSECEHTLSCSSSSNHGQSVDLVPRIISHFDQCLQDHFHIRLTENIRPSVLPKRLIDLERLGTSTVNLYVPGNEEQLTYAALTYCWGKEGNVTTTEKNLLENTKGFDVDSLPQTIQDAITVCRSLSVRYLWIDSLCIIQDNEDDKLGEIQRMGDIYKGSVLTIAAAAASSVQEGFLRFLPPLHSGTQEVPFLLPKGGFGTVAGKLLTDDGKLTPSRGTVTISYKSGALDERGWTLQEHLLSPRLLIFAQHNVIWYCQSAQPVSLLQPYIQYQNQLPRMPRMTKVGLRPREIEEQILFFWREVVEDYSQRRFTHIEDRTLALIGIVNELTSIWNDIYHYGLWEKSFLGLLCWKKQGPCHGLTQVDEVPLVPQASSSSSPSWSWLSLECGVTYSRSWPSIASDSDWSDLPCAEVVGIEGRALILSARAIMKPFQILTHQDSEWSVQDAFDRHADLQHLPDCHMLCIWHSYYCLSVLLILPVNSTSDTQEIVPQNLEGSLSRQGYTESKNENFGTQTFRRVGGFTVPEDYRFVSIARRLTSAFEKSGEEMLFKII